jgi:hypothetical protein
MVITFAMTGLPARAENIQTSSQAYETSWDKAPLHTFYLEGNYDDALCQKTLKILNQPQNKDFGGSDESFNTVESKTSEFKLPEDEQEIKWIKWQPWHPDYEELKRHYSDDRIIKTWLGQDVLNPFTYNFYRTNIAFPTTELESGGASDFRQSANYKERVTIPFIQTHSNDIRYAHRECFIPDVNPPKSVTAEIIEQYNGNAKWCGFFTYDGKIYQSSWYKLASDRPLFIYELFYNKKQNHMTHVYTCGFGYKWQ